MKGYTAKVGMLRPGTRAWAVSQLGNDVHLTRDEWAEFLDYQAKHLTPEQVESLQWWAADPIQRADWVLDQIRRESGPAEFEDHGLPQTRYDSIERTRRTLAYDAGGLLPVVSQTFNASSEPEPVLTPEQAMTELVRMTEDEGLYHQEHLPCLIKGCGGDARNGGGFCEEHQ